MGAQEAAPALSALRRALPELARHSPRAKGGIALLSARTNGLQIAIRCRADQVSSRCRASPPRIYASRISMGWRMGRARPRRADAVAICSIQPEFAVAMMSGL